MDPRDAEILAGCLAGERASWEALVDRHGPRILALLRVRAGPGRAEEAFQEFWRHVMERRGARLSGIDPSRPLGPYLAAIALNLGRRLGAMDRRWRSGGLQEAADPSLTAADLLAREEELSALRQALAALPPRDRLALTLIELDGWSHAQAAGLLGVAPQSVAALAGRTRGRLKREFLKISDRHDGNGPSGG